MSEQVTVEQETVDWEAQRTPVEAKPRRRFWPWVIGIGLGLLACSLLSIALAFGLMGGIVRMMDRSPGRVEVYSDFDTSGRTRGTRGSRGCDCDNCPSGGRGGSYIEYYYEDDEDAVRGERGGRFTIEIDEQDGTGVHGQRRTIDIDEVDGEIEIIEGQIIGRP
jgi:hypothetical protein